MLRAGGYTTSPEQVSNLLPGAAGVSRTFPERRVNMADYDVIVIGTGCGGLSVASQLAHQGRSVLVLEQSDRVGGCCSTFESQGYRFDLGASIIEFVQVINWAFERMGTSVWNEVDLVECDPTYSVILKDGTRMTYPSSFDRSADEIRRISPKDATGWYAYGRAMQGFMDAALAGFFCNPANGLLDMARMIAGTPALLKYGGMVAGSYQDVITKYMKDPRVRESLAFQTFFMGLPPELLPGIYGMIPYGEHKGIYYSKGGMIGIPEAFRRVGERHGMEVCLNTEVRRVMVENGRARGVVLRDGTEIRSRVVVSNINAKVLYRDLIGLEHLSRLARIGIGSYEYSMATPMLYLGVDYDPPLTGHHTLITIPMEEMNSFWWNVYKKGKFPIEQFGIISWTSGTDPDLAPDGHHTIILTLCPGPYRLAGRSWDEAKPELTEKIIEYMSKAYIPGLKEHVKVAHFSSPVDFEKRLLSPEGAIYALRQDVCHSTVFRPAAKSKSIDGLYLVGATTHPGGGVPTTVASGMIAADLINRYEH